MIVYDSLNYMLFDFVILQLLQSNCKLLKVVAPPFETGIIWSNSRFFFELQKQHFPPSLFHTAEAMSIGIVVLFPSFFVYMLKIFPASISSSKVSRSIIFLRSFFNTACFISSLFNSRNNFFFV